MMFDRSPANGNLVRANLFVSVGTLLQIVSGHA